MRRLNMFFLIMVSCLMVTPLNAEESPPVPEFFVKKKCKRCHDAVKEKSGPSLHVIATVYQENSRLLSYVRGETDPIVDPAPDRVKFMKLRRQQMKKLPAEEQQELADYLMSFKEKK